MNTIILIPAYKPDHKFVDFVKELRKRDLNVVAVNDGSGQEFDVWFEEVSALGAVVLTHEVNKGKGRAIKTGIKYIIESRPENDFVVTADCDGQHTPDDIERVISAGDLHRDAIIIGGRFSNKDEKVPARSVLGNTVTRWVFRLATGLPIKDTQTGLRGLPKELLPRLSELKGERYEYEMNMLLYLKEWSIPFVEIPISTIYFNNNKGSHFNTFKDAWRIFKQIAKFCLVGVLSLLLDYVLFKVFFSLGIGAFMAYVFARIISSIFNFVLNSRYVFKSVGKIVVVKYYILALLIMLVGSFGTELITKFISWPVLSKLIIDLPLFLASYVLQREIVFKKKIKKD